jgi:putative hydrolase of the HAD superfamily
VKRPLAAILFDIDDTLFSTSEFADKARRAAIAAMIAHGLRTEPDVALRELDEVIAEFTSNYDHHFDKLVQRLPESASAGVNPAIIVAAGVVAYHETKGRELRVYPDAYEVLQWLAGTPKVLRGIISAGWTIKQAEKVIRLQIHRFLSPQAVFFTDQIGISKPNPKLYRRVLELLGVPPEQAMYVGDNPIHDVDPAKEVGMVAVRCRRSGKHSRVTGIHAPDFEVRDFHELKALLLERFEL